MARTPRETDIDDGDPLDAAAKRLERAVALLETKMGVVKEEVRQSAGSLFDFDRAKLTEDLDVARSHERQLREAGEQASAALGRAISEIRGALAKAEG